MGLFCQMLIFEAYIHTLFCLYIYTCAHTRNLRNIIVIV